MILLVSGPNIVRSIIETKIILVTIKSLVTNATKIIYVVDPKGLILRDDTPNNRCPPSSGRPVTTLRPNAKTMVRDAFLLPI